MPAVVRPLELDDFVAPGDSTRQTERSVRRFRTGVRQQDALSAGNMAVEPIGKFDF